MCTFLSSRIQRLKQLYPCSWQEHCHSRKYLVMVTLLPCKSTAGLCYLGLGTTIGRRFRKGLDDTRFLPAMYQNDPCLDVIGRSRYETFHSIRKEASEHRFVEFPEVLRSRMYTCIMQPRLSEVWVIVLGSYERTPLSLQLSY